MMTLALELSKCNGSGFVGIIMPVPVLYWNDSQFSRFLVVYYADVHNRDLA